MTPKKQVYTIDDPDAVKDHYGHHVAVVGKVNDADKTIHISKRLDAARPRQAERRFGDALNL